MDAPTLALLGVVVAVLLWRALTRERRDYARFKRMRSTVARQKVYRRWVIEAALALGGLSLATIVGARASIAALLADAQEWAPIAAMRSFLGEPYGLWAAIGIAVALLVGMVLPVVLIRESINEAPAVGDIRALLPRTRGELRYGAALSVSAGVFEELLFRLGLPALVFAVTGNAVARLPRRGAALRAAPRLPGDVRRPVLRHPRSGLRPALPRDRIDPGAAAAPATRPADRRSVEP